MHPVLKQCPVCDQELIATRLYCTGCATAVEGRFDLGPLANLSPEQLDFVVTLIRCEGKLNRLQEEYGITYHTARSRLEDVILALGFEIDHERDDFTPVSEQERRDILNELAAGRVSTQDAMMMLHGTESSPESEDAAE